MTFVCAHCDNIIAQLNTPGDELNKNFLCPKCSKDLSDLLKRAKEIQTGLQKHFDKIP